MQVILVNFLVFFSWKRSTKPNLLTQYAMVV